jgi:rod shape-determining protein MreD
MRLTLAAIGAVVAALLQLTIVRYLRIGDAQPDLVLVFVVTVAVLGEFESALVWAFLGGLMIDLLTPRPLGSTVFTLLISVGLASLLGRVLDRARNVAPILAVFGLSFVGNLLLLVIYGFIRGPVPVADLVGMFLPGAVYSTVVALLVLPIVVILQTRAADRERVAW